VLKETPALRVAGAAGQAAHPVQAVLFDLDGTLLDTVADISSALNRALAEQSLPPLPQSVVRTLIGGGVTALVERAAARLAAAGEAPDAGRLLGRFSFHYARLTERGESQTRVYPGVAAGLGGLHALGLPLAVVTNKPKQLSIDLLSGLGLGRWITVVVGGDAGLPRKPHPQPLLTACEELQVPPVRALMVGDSLTDVLAARAAGLRVVCVPYGYNEGADPRTLPCDAFVDSLAELPALLTVRWHAQGAI
jgi:phosphoglycolate phosphatase